MYCLYRLHLEHTTSLLDWKNMSITAPQVSFDFLSIVELLNIIYCLAQLVEFTAFIYLRIKLPHLPRCTGQSRRLKHDFVQFPPELAGGIHCLHLPAHQVRRLETCARLTIIHACIVTCSSC